MISYAQNIPKYTKNYSMGDRSHNLVNAFLIDMDRRLQSPHGLN